jgi:hypothetical protein
MPATVKPDLVTADQSVLPLVVAVTGHRDLVDDELPEIRRAVIDLFSKLRDQYPARRIAVLSPLAQGADQLVAQIAVDLGIELLVPLPMSKALYEADFDSDESLQNFRRLLAGATEVFELPVIAGVTTEAIAEPGPERTRQYAQMGVFLCAHCHILLALWDGKTGTELGGTGQVVKFHHDDIMPGYSSKSVASQQMLVDDESDLVYHIVCSRNRPDGSPAANLKALDSFWFTKDRERPRSHSIPAQHEIIFDRSSEFSLDAIRFAEQIEAEKYPLYSAADEARLPDGVGDINRLFCAADWLAIHFQKKTLRTLRIAHALAFLMGLMFMLYSDLDAQPYFMIAFLLFFFVAATTQYIAKNFAWHRKYLDYRTLAEGLRVQFYWAVAGVTGDNESKFAHDNFLQAQDPELGWIRNVMRVAGMRCDVAANLSASGLDYVMREWIGDTSNGQLAYFSKKTAERLKKHRRTERLGMLSLLTSVAVVLVFVFAGRELPDGWFNPLSVVMGTMLLLYGVRHAYAFATAESELIKQYEFMLRIFHNARRRLDNAEDALEQRQILKALGGSALDEHAEWLLMHRDRSLDENEIWRMGN